MENSNIPLMTTTADTATGFNNAANQQINNAEAAQRILKQHYELMDDREKSRLSSTIVGASQLKTFLDRNDLEGAHNFLTKRKSVLQSRMGSGENVDTQETDYALQAIRSGNVDSLKNEIDGLIAAGQVYGIMDGNDAPASVQEWKFYNALPEDKKREWLINKRSGSVVNLGGTQMQLGPDGKPVASYDVTLKPEDQPANARLKAQATEEGKAAGESNANAKNTMGKMGGLISAYEDIKASASAAPSGGIANTIATGANVSGIGGNAAQAQGTFSVKRAALENEIRQAFRVVGSGATSDRDAVPFINMLPNENDAEDVKLAKINSAMQALQAKVQTLAKERNIPDPFAEYAQGGASGNGKRIIVSSGKETFEIDPADLPAAQAEGFNPK